MPPEAPRSDPAPEDLPPPTSSVPAGRDRWFAAWRAHRGVVLRGCIGSGAVLAVVVLVAAYLLPGHPSFLIESDTRGARITFADGGISVWRLESPVLCLRHARNAPEPPDAAPPDAVSPDAAAPLGCDLEHYTVHRPASAEVEWREGAEVHIRATPDGGLAIELAGTRAGEVVTPEGESDSSALPLPLPRNSRILLPALAWANHAALPFDSRDVVIGALPTAGEEGILIAGRYQIRQSLFLRPALVVVDEGGFTTGDRIAFEDRPRWLSLTGEAQPYRAYGFLAPGVGPGNPGFRAVVYNVPGQTRLQVQRIGASPAHIQENWTHRALRDPYLLILTALVGGIELVSRGGAFRGLRRLQRAATRDSR